MKSNPDYVYDLFDNFLAIDYQHEGDHFLNTMLESLIKAFPQVKFSGYGTASQSSMPSVPYEHFLCTFKSDKDLLDFPTLRIIPLTIKKDRKRGMYIFLSSKSALDECEIVQWRKYIQKSIDEVNKDHIIFPWAAAIEQVSEPSGDKHTLKTQAIIKGCKIRPGGRRYRTPVSSKTPIVSFGDEGQGTNISWPIIIEGNSKACDALSVLEPAADEVYKIAALLSLVWDSYWRLAHSPENIAAGELRVPKQSMTIFGQMYNQYKKYKVMPKLVTKALPIIDNEPILKNALSIYYEGLSLQEEHPSYALLAFVTAIEIVGKSIIGKKGTKAKFMAGVKSVHTKQEAIYFDNLYNSRNNTAHDGVLHADEAFRGSWIMPRTFSPSVSSNFIHGDLNKVRRTARRSLIKAIRQAS